MAQSRIFSNIMAESYQGGNENAPKPSCCISSGARDNSVDSVPTWVDSGDGDHGLATEVAYPLHDIEPLCYDENGNVTDWWCMASGCKYEIPIEKIVQGEVIETREDPYMPGNKEIAVPPTNDRRNSPTQCASSGQDGEESISVPILQRLALDQPNGQGS
jgi:hypothetical protein